MQSIFKSRVFRYGSIFALFLVLILPFQNCSKTSFTKVESASLSTSLSMGDFLYEASLNNPVEFELEQDTSISNVQISSGLNGQFHVISQNPTRINYTPNWGYRGSDTVTVTVTDIYGNVRTYNVTIHVGNALKSLEPALAIRGMGCVQCHAKVDSNIVTDFGYKNDYYFGAKPHDAWWNTGSIYGDHMNSFNTIQMPANKTVYVPKAALPPAITSQTGLHSILDYVRSQFAIAASPDTRQAQIVEKNLIYIGAPTDTDIITAFKLLNSDRSKYFKNSFEALAFSGLKDEGTFFKNVDVLKCEGDLALRGPLLLENLKINSKTGCRLYVIGSVFIFGQITYENPDADRNLQITSTKSISLGLGSAVKNGSNCDGSGQYGSSGSHGPSSLKGRYVDFWTTAGYYTRQSSEPTVLGKSILDEADVIQAKAGVFYDATCRSEGRGVSFDRIILNAPIVHSRYQGDVAGTIIAEFSVMSLGSFKFSFDPVFSRVPIFPFLPQSVYLDVKD